MIGRSAACSTASITSCSTASGVPDTRVPKLSMPQQIAGRSQEATSGDRRAADAIGPIHGMHGIAAKTVEIKGCAAHVKDVQRPGRSGGEDLQIAVADKPVVDAGPLPPERSAQEFSAVSTQSSRTER